MTTTTLTPGEYLATVTAVSVGPTGKNNLLTAIVEYSVEGDSLVNYHNLMKKDGTVNEFTFRSLQKAFGITARDPFALEQGVGCQVRVTLETDTYNDKERLRVAFVNHPEDQGGGGAKTMEEGDRAQFLAQYGSFFRALAETNVKPPVRVQAAPAPAGPPPPKPGPPSTPPPPAPPRPLNAPNAPAPTTQEECWNAFVRQNVNLSESERTKLWFEALRSVFASIAPPADASPAEWTKVLAYPEDYDDVPL